MERTGITMARVLFASLTLGLAAAGVSASPSANTLAIDPIAAAKGFYDGTNTGPYIALNKACNTEAAQGQRGPNCALHEKAAREGDRLIRANPAGFVGLRVRF